MCPERAAARMRLRPSPSCTQQLNWEVSLAPPATDEDTSRWVAWLRQTLPTQGFADVSTMDAFATFQKAGHATIVIVPKTGRVQLRLDIRTPKEERAHLATAFAQQMALGLES